MPWSHREGNGKVNSNCIQQCAMKTQVLKCRHTAVSCESTPVPLTQLCNSQFWHSMRGCFSFADILSIVLNLHIHFLKCGTQVSCLGYITSHFDYLVPDNIFNKILYKDDYYGYIYMKQNSHLTFQDNNHSLYIWA